MNNIVNILQAKRNILLEEIKSAHYDYCRKEKMLNDKINEIDITLAKINEYMEPYICPKCKGTGVVKVCDAAGDTEEISCHTCRGTGLRISKEEL